MEQNHKSPGYPRKDGVQPKSLAVDPAASQLAAMPLQFQTLLYLPHDELVRVFNEAFENYFVPIRLTPELLEQKITCENIRLHLSAGAFSENKLVGFILTGYDEIQREKWAYNAATGVLPAFRGQGVTEAMYRFLFALLDERSIHNHVLEVIENNASAIKVYERSGFTASRQLDCFRGMPVAESSAQASWRFDVPQPEELAAAYEFSDYMPTWQHSLSSVQRCPDLHIAEAVWVGKKLAGATVMMPTAGRVKLLAVHKEFRGQGIGRELLKRMKLASKTGQLSFINIDTRNVSLVRFLERAGLERFLGQQEMILQR